MGCHAVAAAVVVVVMVVIVSRGSKRHYAVGGPKFHFTGRLTGHNSYAELAEFQTWDLSNSSHTFQCYSQLAQCGFCFVTKYVLYASFELENLLPITNGVTTVDGCTAVHSVARSITRVGMHVVISPYLCFPWKPGSSLGKSGRNLTGYGSWEERRICSLTDWQATHTPYTEWGGKTSNGISCMW